MDWTSIVAALVTGGVTLLGVVLANSKTTAILEVRLDEQSKATKSEIGHVREDITDLTRHVEKHNNVIERMYKTESELETSWVRYDELKERVGKLEERK